MKIRQFQSHLKKLFLIIILGVSIFTYFVNNNISTKAQQTQNPEIITPDDPRKGNITAGWQRISASNGATCEVRWTGGSISEASGIEGLGFTDNFQIRNCDVGSSGSSAGPEFCVAYSPHTITSDAYFSRNNPAWVVNYSQEIRLDCDPEVMVFRSWVGDQPDLNQEGALVFWRSDDGYFQFKTAGGGVKRVYPKTISEFVNFPLEANPACGTTLKYQDLGLLPVFGGGIGTGVTIGNIGYRALKAAASKAQGFYNCDERSNLADFQRFVPGVVNPNFGEDANSCPVTNLEQELAKTENLQKLVDQCKCLIKDGDGKEIDIASLDLSNPPEGLKYECTPPGSTTTTIYEPDGQGGLTRVSTQTPTQSQSEGPVSGQGLFEVLFRIVLIALTIVFFVFSTIAVWIFFFVASLALGFLAINPASAEFVTVAADAWGILVGVGNLLILGAFIYTGIGFLLGIESMRGKGIGDFLMKIIYYAVLLNFTLLATAALVNVSHGIGSLIAWTIAGSTDISQINNEIAGGLIENLGRISLIRCGNIEGDSCSNDPGGALSGVGEAVFGSFKKAFTDGDALLTHAIAEGVFLVIMGLAIYVFFRTMYLSIYRVAVLWFLMITSPIALASAFSPVESFREIWKQWQDKFVNLLIFYPAFMFALVLVSALSGSLGTAINSNTFLNGEGSSAGANQIFGSDIQSSLLQIVVLITAGAISIMALFLVNQYFLDKFEKDLNQLKDAALTSFQKGWGVVKGGAGLVGGTVANAGRLISLLDPNYKKKWQNESKEKKKQIKELRRLYLDETDPEEKKKKLAALRNAQAEKRTYDLRAQKGRGGALIDTGNTIGYGLPMLESAGKRAGEWFKQSQDARRVQSDAWWKAKVTEGLKGLPGFKNDPTAQALIDTLLPENALQGLSPGTIEQLRNQAALNGDDDPIPLLIQDAQTLAYRKALGINEELRSEIALQLAKFIRANGIQDLDEYLRENPDGSRELESLINTAAKNEAVARELFSSESGRSLTQQMMKKGLISDPATRNYIADRAPSVLGDYEDRYTAGRDAVQLTPEELNKIDFYNFQDSAFFQGYMDNADDEQKAKLIQRLGKSNPNNGSLVKEASSLAERYGTSVGGTVREHIERNKEREKTTPIEVGAKLQEELNKVHTKYYEQLSNAQREHGHDQDELSRQISQIENRKKRAVDEIFNSQLERETGLNYSGIKLISKSGQSGGEKVQEISSRVGALNLSQLERTNAGQRAINSANADPDLTKRYNRLSEAEKITLLRRATEEQAIRLMLAGEQWDSNNQAAADSYGRNLAEGIELTRLHKLEEEYLEDLVLPSTNADQRRHLLGLEKYATIKAAQDLQSQVEAAGPSSITSKLATKTITIPNLESLDKKTASKEIARVFSNLVEVGDALLFGSLTPEQEQKRIELVGMGFQIAPENPYGGFEIDGMTIVNASYDGNADQNDPSYGQARVQALLQQAQQKVNKIYTSANTAASKIDASNYS